MIEKTKHRAFTMAEILLSLTIIGIVAAITLPSLTANFQDKAFNAKRQALHARLSQALRTMDLSEYIPLDKRIDDIDNGGYIYPNIDNFMEDLTKSLSIKVISDPEMIFGYKDEGSNNKNNWYYPLGNSSGYPFAGEPNAYFQTVNGESIGLLFATHVNTSDKKEPYQSMLFALVYDLNGQKGPNKWGKDRGIMGAFYYDNVELYAPMPGAITNNMINEDCDPNDSSCQRYKYPDYRLPSPEELAILAGYGGMSDILPNIEGSTPICALDGHKYKFYWGENLDDGDNCTYILITNDGNSPKNGVVLDMGESSDNSNEDPSNAQ